jgi:lysozyme
MNQERLLVSVKRHEGYRATPYKDSLGYWTVGYGHLIHNMQLSALVNYRSLGDLLNWISDPATHESWLRSDILEAESDARRWIGDAWDKLSDVRKEIITEMAFQLGADRLAGFAKLRSAILDRNWAIAKAEMLDSRWAQQTPSRANELARRMVESQPV